MNINSNLIQLVEMQTGAKVKKNLVYLNKTFRSFQIEKLIQQYGFNGEIEVKVFDPEVSLKKYTEKYYVLGGSY